MMCIRTKEATRRKADRDEALAWKSKSKDQEHRAFKWKKRFFNSRALTGHYQRYSMCVCSPLIEASPNHAKIKRTFTNARIIS